jgi:hypothetical protein
MFKVDAFKTQIGYDTKGTQQVDSKMQRGTESKKKTYHQEGRSGHQIDRHLYGQFARKKTKEEMVLHQRSVFRPWDNENVSNASRYVKTKENQVRGFVY